MSKRVKPREVLSVQKHGPEYYWFNLKVDGLPCLSVGNDEATWKIDEKLLKTVAYIKKGYEKTGEKKCLKIKKVLIVGPANQIKNLLFNLGDGIPTETCGPRWEKEEDFLD